MQPNNTGQHCPFHVPTNPAPAGAGAGGRRSLFGAAAALAVAAGLVPAATAEVSEPDLFEKSAALEFDGVAGAVAALGTIEVWMRRAADEWATMRMVGEVLQDDHLQLAARMGSVTCATDVFANFAVDLGEHSAALRERADVIERAQFRIFAAISRHYAAIARGAA